MISKIPYEIIAIEANKLLDRGALLSVDDINYQETNRLYLAFLEACGWTDKEYDEETMKRIDNNWDDSIKYKPIILN